MNEWMREAPKKTFHSPSNPKHLHPEQQGMSIDKGSFAHAYRPCIGRSGWLGQDDVDQSSWAGCQASHSVWLYVADDTERHIVSLRLSDGAKLAAPFLLFWLHASQVAWRNETFHQQGILQPRGSWIPRSLLANANWRLSAVEKTTPKEAIPVKDRKCDDCDLWKVDVCAWIGRKGIFGW